MKFTNGDPNLRNLDPRRAPRIATARASAPHRAQPAPALSPSSSVSTHRTRRERMAGESHAAAAVPDTHKLDSMAPRAMGHVCEREPKGERGPQDSPTTSKQRSDNSKQDPRCNKRGDRSDTQQSEREPSRLLKVHRCYPSRTRRGLARRCWTAGATGVSGEEASCACIASTGVSFACPAGTASACAGSVTSVAAHSGTIGRSVT